MDRVNVFQAVIDERDHQDHKWGTVREHPHEVGGWICLMRKLLCDAETAWSTSPNDHGALE
jgi:hypothetical protein